MPPCRKPRTRAQQEEAPSQVEGVSVSQQLAQCEKDVGVALYEKVGRRVRLTEQGEILASYTTFQTIMSSLVPRALTELAREFPDLRVQIVQREADGSMELLPRRELLLDDPLRLITPLTGPWSTLRLEDFAAFDDEIPFAMDPEEFYWGVSFTGCAAGMVLTPAYETPDLFLDEIEGVRVVPLPGNPTRTLYTAVRAGREGHPALRAFREALGKAAATAKDFGPLPAV
ncbi:LysR family transcriptional regulator [Corynebacterium aurimucosum]|uniref:LysR family transcriptional regulator n=1 Tax=Corynebacterium aurimucosum TaxID=169292 RepID=UPI003990D00D